jgi:phosphatidate cytidylyltransferase
MLGDMIVKNTLALVGMLFFVILLLTIKLDYKKRRAGKIQGIGEYWLRYITFIFLAPLFLIPAYLGRPYFNFLVVLMSALYLKEFFRMTQVWQHKVYRWEGRIFTVLVLLGTLFENKFLFFRIPILVFICVLATPVFLRKVEDAVRQTAITIIGILYFGWMFSYAVFLRDSFGFGGIVFVCILVTIDDLACFWVGKSFGKHKLIPEISPGKTVEGALGGVIVTVLFASLMKYALPEFSYIKCALLGLTISLTGQIGDLVLSVIKRDMGAKDAGKILPGHGGMLDRFTSWIFTLPVIYYILHWIK